MVEQGSGVPWPDVPELWNLLDRYEDRWKFAYPGLNIQAEVLRMMEWCEANRSKQPKKNWHRFAVTWLNKNQRGLEQANWREELQRAQRHADARVGLWEGYRKGKT